jgi:hypothetical protein
LIIAPSVNPINVSGEINLTYGNPHSTANHAATLVFPDPYSPSNKTEFNYEFLPNLV